MVKFIGRLIHRKKSTSVYNVSEMAKQVLKELSDSWDHRIVSMDQTHGYVRVHHDAQD